MVDFESVYLKSILVQFARWQDVEKIYEGIIWIRNFGIVNEVVLLQLYWKCCGKMILFSG